MTEQPRITDRGRRPRLVAPPGATDTHSHIYGPRERYPHHPGRTPDLLAELPAYEAMLARIGLERAVIVQPSLYSFDNRATLDAIAAMGLGRARGVAVCRPEVTAAELRDLHERGIRALRFFLLADDVGLDDLEPMAARCADLGWHVVVQGEGDWLIEAAPLLRRLPCPVVVDHLGRTPPSAGVDHPGFRALLDLVEAGNCWTKISAPYLSSEVGPPGYEDCAPRVRALADARPDRLLWAANWPHPNMPLDALPDEADCLDLLLDQIGDEAVIRAALAENPARLYGFE